MIQNWNRTRLFIACFEQYEMARSFVAWDETRMSWAEKNRFRVGWDFVAYQPDTHLLSEGHILRSFKNTLGLTTAPEIGLFAIEPNFSNLVC